MENPNAGGVNLRRHNSLPSARRSSPHFAHHRNRLPAKSSPHVGFFRHSPGITSQCLSSARRVKRASMIKVTSSCRDYRCKTTTKSHREFELQYSATTLPYDKSSPYVGWFRHAPPASRSSVVFRTMLSEYLETELALLLRAIPTPDCNGLLRLTDLLCSGHLMGGSPHQDKVWSTGSSKSSSSSSIGSNSPSLTAHVLRRVAGWILTPFLEDDEFLSQRQQQHDTTRMCKASSLGRADDASSLYSHDSQDPSYDDSSSSALHDDDDGNSSCCSTIEAAPVEESSAPPPSSSLSPVLDRRRSRSSSASSASSSMMMVSSQAEAYYAHNAVSKPYQTLQECNVYESTASTATSSNENNILGHRLDYNITQMDIVRMTRNASRHLDVESILKLPTVTYQSPLRRSGSSSSSTRRTTKNIKKMYKIEEDKEDVGTSAETTTTHHREEEWSWMMVHQDGDGDAIAQDSMQGSSDGDNKSSRHGHGHHHQDAECECVICLEPFVEGDRLRVLPCDHSFHVGCIDRWLSGSHSFDECYTAGCPTCKKHPCQEHNDVDVDDDEHEEEDHFLVGSTYSDGSVPSWAFSRIGNALARASSSSLSSSSPSPH